MVPVRIAGTGYYLPEQRVTTAEISASLAVPPGWIERAAGVVERRRVAHETSSEMAAEASRMALAQAGLELAEVDAIIGASASPQQAIPCTASLVQRELGAPDGESACFDVNATCLSFLVAFQMASHLIEAGVYSNVLVFSSEITSHSLNPSQPESLVLFGDAAAAAVLTRSGPGEASGVWHTRIRTYSSGADLTRFLGAGTLHHPNDPLTTPEMNMFHMDGGAVFKKATRLMAPFLDEFFQQVPWQRDEVDLVVPHQASRHGIEQLTARLGFRSDQLFMNLAERGNCIAASMPLALAEAAQNGRLKRGHKVLLVGTGAGLTLAASAVTF